VSAVELDIELEARPQAASAARRAIDRFRRDLPEDVLEDLKLMVSELVTNSCRHAGLSANEGIHLRLGFAGGGVRVEVEDHGRFRPPVAPGDNGSGWGLKIVDRLADRWGIEDHEGTLVWFEMRDGLGPGGVTPNRSPDPRS
jgi:anti-sigma regulatory factor (Ser/Thr protein kinase)